MNPNAASRGRRRSSRARRVMWVELSWVQCLSASVQILRKTPPFPRKYSGYWDFPLETFRRNDRGGQGLHGDWSGERPRIMEVFETARPREDHRRRIARGLPGRIKANDSHCGAWGPDAAGVVVEFVGTCVDVTDQHRARTELRKASDELRKAENQLRAIINTLRGFAWSVRPHGSADFFNQF